MNLVDLTGSRPRCPERQIYIHFIRVIVLVKLNDNFRTNYQGFDEISWIGFIIITKPKLRSNFSIKSTQLVLTCRY